MRGCVGCTYQTDVDQRARLALAHVIAHSARTEDREREGVLLALVFVLAVHVVVAVFVVRVDDSGALAAYMRFCLC